MDIREARKQLGWTQTQMARELGIGRAYLCRMELGGLPVSKRTEMAVELLLLRHGKAEAA